MMRCLTPTSSSRPSRLFILCVLLLLALPVRGTAQDDPALYDPLDDIIGEPVFVGRHEIGKTAGKNNYIALAVWEYRVLSADTAAYYIGLTAVDREQTEDRRKEKILTLADAREVAAAVETLRSTPRTAGALPGARAVYAFSDDLRFVKHFDTGPAPWVDRGRVIVGFRPYTASAELNIADFEAVGDLLRRAITFVEARRTDGASAG